ncbi:hypothetical protein NGH46_12655 [Staphylococcus xylosus]|uniref:hypothetical protein n=1 Tax=Staphylococcus xylosus TaxID=1288 RepID=UPI002DBD8B60|nr:hypothetical protein [Staphylococcus xylosus]MEB8122976.1 hypothetical protein [Staphylococcus xylosus]
MKFLTKKYSHIGNKFDPNTYNYDYLLNVDQELVEVGHFVSKDALKNDDTIAGSKVFRCTDITKFKSCFGNKYNTEHFHISNIYITNDEDRHKGVMTIIVCDILLAILDREMGWYNNIEVSLVDQSKVIDDKGCTDANISVYNRIFRGYVKGTNTTDERLVVDGNDLNYLFPIKTRRDDISYYQNLRKEKIERFEKMV